MNISKSMSNRKYEIKINNKLIFSFTLCFLVRPNVLLQLIKKLRGAPMNRLRLPGAQRRTLWEPLAKPIEF